MSVSFNVDNGQMQIMRSMMESMNGLHFVRADKEKPDQKAGEIIATCKDAQGNEWIARTSQKNLNPAQKDMAGQILRWVAARGMG
jgi:hypothetical protein